MESLSKAAKNVFNENSTSFGNTLSEAIVTETMVKSLNGFYDMVGHKPEEEGTLAVMAKYFFEKGVSPSQLTTALNLCVEQCQYPVRLPDIMQRIPGYEVPTVDAEARAKWDILIRFVEKYVSNNVHGEYGPEYGWYGTRYDSQGMAKRPATYPEIEQRVLDVVRRTGGWKQYKCMTEADLPFQQKRFFEEYKAWAAVEKTADESRLLPMRFVRQLPATGGDRMGDIGQPAPNGLTERLNGGSEPQLKRREVAKLQRSDEWYAERRAKLKQQAEEVSAKRKS